MLPKARIIEKLSNKEGLKELPRVETDVRDAATVAIDYIPEQLSTRRGEMDPTDVDQIANKEESR